MHFTNILAVAALAILPAAAAPNSDITLAERGQCKANLYWNGFHKSCQCENKSCQYDDSLKKCHYPVHPVPSCKYGEIPYCARSYNEHCKYDTKNDYCFNDGKSYVFCCKEKDFPKKIKEVCPPSPPSCPSDQHWDYPTRKCVCETGKIYRNGKCCHAPLPKPSCGYGQKPYCAKDANSWCEYNDKNDYCDNDGNNVAFCCEPPKIKDTCNKKWTYGY